MSKVRVFGRSGSVGARLLARGLGGMVLLEPEASRWRARENDVLVRWGRSDDCADMWRAAQKVGNSAEAVKLCANKVYTFEKLNWVSELLPMWSRNKEGANTLFHRGAQKVYCRTVVSGHGGAGIVVAHSPEELVDAPLYVTGVEVYREFRVHVFFVGGEATYFVQRKLLPNETRDTLGEAVNWDVRNWENGYRFFSRDVSQVGRAVIEKAKLAVKKLGCVHGAVDVVQNRQGGTFVLECNSAPGLDEDGPTLEFYVRGFKQLIDAL